MRQAEFFLESYDIDAVILLELPDEEVAARVLTRRVCAGCGLDYNVVGRLPDERERCATCGGELVMREDDNPEALGFYEKLGYRLDAVTSLGKRLG